MLVLATTDNHPYNLHLASILAVPSGLGYRFRYRHRWVDINDASIGELDGTDALIVFYRGGGHFVPIRRCTLLKSYDYGDVKFFELVLGPVVDYRDRNFAAYDRLFSERMYAGKRQEDDSQLVRLVPNITPKDIKVDPETDAPDSRAMWTELVQHLGTLNSLKEVAFFRLSLKCGDKVIAPQKLAADAVGYEICSGSTYKLTVFEYVGGMTDSERLESSFDFSLATDSAAITTLKAKERIDGTYDRFDLSFRAAQIITSLRTYITVTSGQQIGGAKIPELYIPIDISNSAVKKAVALIGTVICPVGLLIPRVFPALLASSFHEPRRVCRRAHSERGWTRCPDPASTPPSCVSAPSAWCSTTPTSIPPNGPRFDPWPRRSAARPRHCDGGYAKLNAIEVSGLA